eukprot:2558203-Rhodomonas_salina.3
MRQKSTAGFSLLACGFFLRYAGFDLVGSSPGAPQLSLGCKSNSDQPQHRFAVLACHCIPRTISILPRLRGGQDDDLSESDSLVSAVLIHIQHMRVLCVPSLTRRVALPGIKRT